MPRTQAAKKDETSAVRRAAPVRSTRRDIDTREHKVGQDKPRAMKSRGPAREALEPSEVQPVERVVSQEKLEALRFMEEELTIMVHQTTNPVDDPIPVVWNDGKSQYFVRGQRQQVKRKYVEVLARAKQTAYGNEKYKDPKGDDAYRYPASTALKYPFSVIHDPSGDRGAAWLKSVMQEA